MAYCHKTYGQTTMPKKNTVGIQVNPTIPTLNLNNIGVLTVLRYGYTIHSHYTIGSDFSLHYTNTGYSKSTKILPALFFRYTFRLDKLVNPFIDFNLGYEFYHLNVTEPNWSLEGEHFMYNGLNYYFAPGVKFASKNRMFSFDLMLKMSTQSFYVGYKLAPAFRFNFHF